MMRSNVVVSVASTYVCLVKSPTGWMAWGPVVSRVFDPFCDIFYPDGHPRPAAIYLEKTLKGGGKPE
jgi:hypothetical protein